MEKSRRYSFWFALVLALLAMPAGADLSVFLATVGFDEDANLDNSLGIGLRWGRSSAIIGGETSLLIARPERQLPGTAENATAIFYEGRLMVNIPVGSQVRPFVGVGLGRVTITSVDPTPPDGLDEVRTRALNSVADGQSNTTISYGGGAHYSLDERFAVRVDIRQYSVLSVASLVASQIEDRVGDTPLADKFVKDRTVQYNELSIGLNFKF